MSNNSYQKIISLLHKSNDNANSDKKDFTNYYRNDLDFHANTLPLVSYCDTVNDAGNIFKVFQFSQD